MEHAVREFSAERVEDEKGFEISQNPNRKAVIFV